MNCGSVEPSRRLTPYCPSPVRARISDASTTAWPSSARRTVPPRIDGPSATPMARKREAISVAATIAVIAEPPALRTASVANCAAPENTTTDITTGATEPQPTVTAETPNDAPISAVGMTSGRAARIPAA